MASLMFFGILLAVIGATVTCYVMLRSNNALWGVNSLAAAILLATYLAATDGDADAVIASLQEAFGWMFGALAVLSVFAGYMYLWYGLHAYEEYRVNRLDPQDDKHPDANPDADA